MSEACTCPLCVPNPRVRHDPKYGYDLDAVPRMRCLSCGDLIGEEEYVEERAWARFGQMMFRHARCEHALTQQSTRRRPRAR